MTLIFGNLVDDFNNFGAGASSRERFRDSVNDNTLVGTRLLLCRECANS